MNIEVNNNWNGPSQADVKKLLEYIYSVFKEVFNDELDSDIVVNNNPTYGNPLANYDKIDGKYFIILAVSSGSLWAQVAYQFTHELCHLFCNFAESQDHKHKWFEESICELASIVNIYQLSNRWAIDPPYLKTNYWAIYFKEYADNLLANTTMVEDDDFKEWFSANVVTLEINSTNRSLNSVVAKRLFNQFGSDNSFWKTVRSLNKWDCHSNDCFKDFLTSWKDQNPDHGRSIIETIENLFLDVKEI